MGSIRCVGANVREMRLTQRWLTPLGVQIAFFGPNFKLPYLSRSGELEAQIKVCWSRRRIFQVVVRVCNNIGKTYTFNGYIRQGVGGFWLFGVLSVYGRNSVNIGS